MRLPHPTRARDARLHVRAAVGSTGCKVPQDALGDGHCSQTEEGAWSRRDAARHFGSNDFNRSCRASTPPAAIHCRPHACCGMWTLLGLPRKLSRHHVETDRRECSDHLTPTQQYQAIMMQVNAILKTSMLVPPGGEGVESTSNTTVIYRPNLTTVGKGSGKCL